MSKCLSKNDLYKETLCFLSGLCLCKVFRDRVFRAIKVRLKKMSKHLPKNDFYYKTLWFLPGLCLSQSIWRSSVSSTKVRSKKMSKRLSKNDLYYKTLCFLSGLCLCESFSRLSVSCYQNSIDEDVERPFKKWFVLRDPVFPFWNMSLSKYFEIVCFVLSKFDWIKCLNVFSKNDLY